MSFNTTSNWLKTSTVKFFMSHQIWKMWEPDVAGVASESGLQFRGNQRTRWTQVRDQDQWRSRRGWPRGPWRGRCDVGPVLGGPVFFLIWGCCIGIGSRTWHRQLGLDTLRLRSSVLMSAPICWCAPVASTPRWLCSWHRSGPLHLTDEMKIDVIFQTFYRLLLVSAEDAAVVVCGRTSIRHRTRRSSGQSAGSCSSCHDGADRGWAAALLLLRQGGSLSSLGSCNCQLLFNRFCIEKGHHLGSC